MTDAIKAALEIARTGSLPHHGPGRHDDLETSVPGESFVVPADIVSALGDGNTLAGFKVLDTYFPGSGQQRPQNDKVPIVAAGGEYIVGPEHIARLGKGDLKAGHKRLREFVTKLRAANVKRLKALPPPVRG